MQHRLQISPGARFLVPQPHNKRQHAQETGQTEHSEPRQPRPQKLIPSWLCHAQVHSQPQNAGHAGTQGSSVRGEEACSMQVPPDGQAALAQLATFDRRLLDSTTIMEAPLPKQASKQDAAAWSPDLAALSAGAAKAAGRCTARKAAAQIPAGRRCLMCHFPPILCCVAAAS